MKPCRKCLIPQDISNYSKHSGCAGGFDTICKTCKKQYDKKYYADPEIKKHHANVCSNWAKNNRDKMNSTFNKRRALQIQAIPKWADLKEINKLYLEAALLTKSTGIVYHVDHIHPLQGEYICGLHVIENLQIIPALENFSKHNTFTPYVESEL